MDRRGVELSTETQTIGLSDILHEILPRPEDLRITPSTASQNAVEHVNIVIYGRNDSTMPYSVEVALEFESSR